jgi:hypothetical protein
MAEYIEREALLKDIEESVVFSVRSGQPSAEIRGANKITDRIKSAPAADVVEVRHGEWDWYPDRMDRQELLCTNCEEPAPYNEDGERARTSYCPNCGAKMDGKGEGE